PHVEPRSCDRPLVRGRARAAGSRRAPPPCLRPHGHDPQHAGAAARRRCEGATMKTHVEPAERRLVPVRTRLWRSILDTLAPCYPRPGHMPRRWHRVERGFALSLSLVLLLGAVHTTPAHADDPLPSVDEITAHLDDLYRSKSSHGEMSMEVN